MDELIERLRDESLALRQTAWGRMDGGQECTLSATLADEAADTIIRLREALEQAKLAIEGAAYGGHVGALNEAHGIIEAALNPKTDTIERDGL